MSNRITTGKTVGRIKQFITGVVVLCLLVAYGLPASSVSAASFTKGVKVSFTFDDGFASTLLAADVLAEFGYTGTAYVTTDCIGKGRVANCAASKEYEYLTWESVATLQDQYGWEIGSHTVTHASLPDVPYQDMAAELRDSKAALVARGYAAESFALPYGHYNNEVLAEGAKYYSSIRRFEDTENNVYPYNGRLVMIRGVQAGISVEKVKGYIDQATANGYWLVLVFHEISETASREPDDYEYTPAELREIAAYIQSKNVPVVNMTEGLVDGSEFNLLSNSSFDNGIADGWTTDDPDNIVADSGNNGSYPSSINSVLLQSSAENKNTHLFSPQITINPAERYIIKTYLNVQQISSGEVSFYIDEYDAAGEWISGSYAPGVASSDAVRARDVNFIYTPSSADVVTARLEVILKANSGVKAYIDNIQWIPESALLGTAPPQPQEPEEPQQPPVDLKQGDVNGDGKIDGFDLDFVLRNWGQAGKTRAEGDLNGDTMIDGFDLDLVLRNWSLE